MLPRLSLTQPVRSDRATLVSQGMSSVKCQRVRPFGVFNTVLAISSSGYYARARARAHTHTRSSVVNSPLSRIICVFLAVFVKLKKTTMIFVMCVRLSAWINSTSTGRIFVKFGIWIFFENIEKIQVSLKSDKNESYFTWRLIHIFDHTSLNSS